MKQCAECPATVRETKCGMIRANIAGWMFLGDGRTYCPDHLPDWVADWRRRNHEGIIPGE